MRLTFLKIVLNIKDCMKNYKKQDLKKSSKKNKIPSLIKSKKILIIALIIILFIIYKLIVQKNNINNIKNNLLPQAVKKILRNEKANISIDYLKETSGIYEFQLTLKDQNNQKFISYITKDGKILFISGIKTDELLKNQTTTSQTTKKLTCNDLKKSSQPKLTAYVMANCPYGLQMQRVFKNIINTNAYAKDNLRVEYIFNQNSNFETGELDALHGKEEAQENLRQICIREEQTTLYWPYVSCYMQKENNSENCLNQVGVNTISLDQCLTDKNRGLKYAKKDFENTKKLGIAGSPTLVLNDTQIVSEFDFGGRNPNTIKEILCCSSDKKLAYCNEEFSKDDVAVSFSATDKSEANSSSAGGCSN